MILIEYFNFLSHLNSRICGLILCLVVTGPLSAEAGSDRSEFASEPHLPSLPTPSGLSMNPTLFSTPSTFSDVPINLSGVATDPERWLESSRTSTDCPLSRREALSLLGRDHTLLHLRVHPAGQWPYSGRSIPRQMTGVTGTVQDPDERDQDQEDGQDGGEQERERFPDPIDVLYRSMIIPGWGQVTNRQIWKVPIIYGLFAGLGYYNYTLTQQYRGYRAAYYNATREGESDFRFGQTPDFIPEGLTTQEMRDTRDRLRNQRDFSYVMIFLAYGLNLLDAYVYAHMRSFDVSDDLSAEALIAPGIMEQGVPGVHVRVSLFNSK